MKAKSVLIKFVESVIHSDKIYMEKLCLNLNKYFIVILNQA